MLYFNKNELKAQMERKNVNTQDIADALGVSKNTVYNRFRDGNFTRAEIGRLIEFLDITNINDIFFVEELADKQNLA